MFENNMGAIRLAKFVNAHGRTTHVDINLHYTRKQLDAKTFALHHVAEMTF